MKFGGYMNISESYILGVILSKFGLTLEDAYKIQNGQLKLNKNSEEIRDFLLENSEIKTLFLRKLVNYGLNLNDLSSTIPVTFGELQSNIDNNFYWLNGIDFAIKINSHLRKKIGQLLYSKGYSFKIIGDLLGVSATTIHTDSKNGWI